MTKKLIRDKIPEIIKNKQNSKKKHIGYIEATNNETFYDYLKQKLLEEVNEFIKADNFDNMIEELADINEVLDTIYKFNNIDIKTVKNIQTQKFKEKGGFEKRIIWEFEE